MDEGALYKARLEKEQREEAERQAAIAKDSIPYDPDDMQGRTPLSCGLIVATLFALSVAAVVWLAIKLVRGL